ncbi:MAG: sulfur oxidation c-type cytochrome SoxA [Pseudomonadota bacterium]
MRPGWVLSVLVLLPISLCAGEVKSGYEYLSAENRAMQDDDFSNPGLLWVDEGAALWRQPLGKKQKSCQSCHDSAQQSMRGVRARYPIFDEVTEKPLNIPMRINRCLTEHSEAEALAYDAREMIALTTFIGHQSQGLPVQLDEDERLEPFIEQGNQFFYQRRGRLDLACHHCHERNTGQQLRGEIISQGQTNGYPAYRHVWQKLGTQHQLFLWCNEAVQSEAYPLGSDTYVNLELYMARRAAGLQVETPAVRR